MKRGTSATSLDGRKLVSGRGDGEGQLGVIMSLKF
jgi:hypothetical protein